MRRGVLFVCTANLCRSPLAEGLSRTGPFATLGWPTASAGTRALAGQPAHPASVRALAAHGGSLPDFTSRPLDHVDLPGSALVLVATPAHHAAVVRAAPAVRDRTFLLRQFARLAATLTPRPDGRDPSALVADVLEARRRVVAPHPDADVLQDPIGRPQADFDRTADLIAADLRAIARAALPAGSAGSVVEQA